MSRRNLLGMAVFALWISIAPTVEANSADLRIRLAGAGGKGSAKYRDRGNVREFQVEVENLNLAPGTLVQIQVNGVAVGSATVTTLRTARLSLSTQRGNAVPQIASGSTVTVVGLSGNVLVSGQF